MKGTGLCFFDCSCYMVFFAKTINRLKPKGAKEAIGKPPFFQEIAIGDNDTGNVVLLSSEHQM